MSKRVVIVGAGPSGLFCAKALLDSGFEVDLYDQSNAPGLKFLVAGKSGLNLTHSENINKFVTKYGKDQEFFQELLKDFSPDDLRSWSKGLGIETYVGSTGRVFPVEMKGARFLKLWVEALKANPKFNLFLKHSLVEMVQTESGIKKLNFETPNGSVAVESNLVICALGGASWKRTGSDGKWKTLFEKLGIKLQPFLAMNCGFEATWSELFKEQCSHKPLKNVVLSFQQSSVRGELMLTAWGIEGGVVYSLSGLIRDEILKNKSAKVSLDLKPDLSLEEVIEKLNRKNKKSSLSNHLRKSLSLSKEAFYLLKELLDDDTFKDLNRLAQSIKNVDIELTSIRPMEEAISTSGGVEFSELNPSLEVKKIPGLYLCGEMLDFEAPTGGYLLQGCFSSAYRVTKNITSL